jgi:ribosomal protein S18 acetylase RimI-like enzyme
VSALRVRPAAEADAATVAVLVTQLGYPSDVSQVLARMRRVQDDPDIRMLVAENDAGIVGMIGIMVFPAFHRDGLHGYITALAVEEAVRGSGAGATLLKAAEAWFAGRGIAKVTLTTAAHRERAHRFYEKHGYEFNGRRYVKSLI